MARIRALALRAAGYAAGCLIPQCELEGRPDRMARLAYLCGHRGDVVFTRSDRSMVLRNLGQYGGWWAVVDDECLPGQWPTKAAALAAARHGEKANSKALADAAAEVLAVAEARSEVIPEWRLHPDPTAWMRAPAVRHEIRRREMARLSEVVAAGIAGIELDL